MVDIVKDPVCGTEIRPKDAVATEVHDGRTFSFCSHACHQAFVNDPHRYEQPSEVHGVRTISLEGSRAGAPP